MAGRHGVAQGFGAHADVVVTEADVWSLGKSKLKSVMDIDPGMLQPAFCLSKQGISSASQFTRAPNSAAAGVATQDYAALFDKYYGPGSLMTSLLQKQKQRDQQQLQKAASAETGGSQARRLAASDRVAAIHSETAQRDADMARAAAVQSASDALLDKEIKQRAVREIRAKYLTPQLLAKFGMQQPGQPTGTSAAATAAALAALSGQGKGKGGPAVAPESALLLAELDETEGREAVGRTERYRQKVLSQLRERGVAVPGAPQRSASAAAASQREAGGDVGGQGATGQGHRSGGGSRPGSAAFKAVGRDHARRTGSYFVEMAVGADSPGPWKYTRKYGAHDGHVAVPAIDPPTYRESLLHVARQGQEAHLAGAGGGAGGARSTSPAHAAGATTTAKGDAEDAPLLSRPALFKDAWHVHARRPASAPGAGTPSFKAVPRPQPDSTTTASHLALKYFREGYDASVRKPTASLLLPFGKQTSRVDPGTAADTPPALGPGAYLHGSNVPGSLTGRHVSGNHMPLPHTREWARSAARPGSAPAPARPKVLSAKGTILAQQPDLYPTAYPDDLELVAVHNLQQYAAAQHAQHAGAAGAGHRPTSVAPPQHAQHAQQQQQQQQQRSDALGDGQGILEDDGFVQADDSPYGYGDEEVAAAARAAGAEAAIAAAAGAAAAVAAAEAQGMQPEDGPGQYLHSETLGKFSSTGFAKKVPGGAFSVTSRAESAKSSRMMSDGKVIPPAAVAVLVAGGADKVYEPCLEAQGHWKREPAWKLPPNRNALSNQWVTTAATAYI